jgi:D-alanine--poly(phosphoribitol) ligase subunit 1
VAHVFNLGLKFREIATAYAKQPALRYLGEEYVSYGRLDQFSNQIAHLLLEHGLTRGDVVVIFHDKSAAAFATMLACLKAGLIYTNLDPASPWERLRKIIETCAPKAIVNGFGDLPHSHFLNRQPAIVLSLRDSATATKLEEHDATPVPNLPDVTGAHPAYIMFTSGSTGMPKGAVMSHANVFNFIRWSRDRFEITPADILSNVNPMYFDNSVFDFYASLFSGASMAPVASAAVRDSRKLIHAVNSAPCTIWFSVPSLLVYLLTTRALSSNDFPGIRKIIFGGEGFPKPKLKQLYDLFGGRAELENVYGPTECTCICSSHTIKASDFADMKALATLGFLASDFACEILGTGEAKDEGELFLCGPNVGLGYYNDPERTAGAFIQNPTHRRFRDIGYRTGDLVRRDQDGRLHFIGRTDFQIKHMGYRIELEEIEAALGSLPEVSECAVIYRKLGDGLGELVGFAVLAKAAASDELLRGVAAILPAYMVPRRITALNVLPRNANGKIDRIALQGVASQPV